jgi:hypothetical protein
MTLTFWILASIIPLAIFSRTLQVFLSGPIKRREFWCAFWERHDYHLKAERRRKYLQCVNCGHESPGFQIDARMAAGLAKRRKTSVQLIAQAKRDAEAAEFGFGRKRA